MSAMSDYLEGEIIKHIFRTGSFAKPTNLAIGLFTAAPSDAGGGTEVSGGGYARASTNTDPLDANWAAPDGGDGETSNVQTVTFPTPSADWGVVTHFGIFDADSAGNLLFQGALAISKTINNGDAVAFAPGTLVITFT